MKNKAAFFLGFLAMGFSQALAQSAAIAVDPNINPIDTVRKSEYAHHKYQAQWIWSNVQMPEQGALFCNGYGVREAPLIGPEAPTPDRFQFVRFRKSFKLDSVPKTAVALVAADTFYRLWINGQLVMHGPARSSVNKVTVDPLAIEPYLRPGDNTVEAAVCYLRDPMFEAFSKAPGFLCELRLKEGHKTRVIATDETWQACEISAWNRQAPRLSAHRGMALDDIDARLYSQEHYKPAAVLGKVGIPPWRIVELRDIPLPAPLREVRPVRVVSILRGDGQAPDVELFWYEKGLSTPNPTPEKPSLIQVIPDWLRCLQAEKVTPDSSAAVNAEGVTASGTEDTILQDNGAQITYDLGAYYVGFVGFEVTGEAGQVLDLAWSARLSEPGPTARPRDGHPFNTNKAMHYILSDGRQSYLGFPIRSLRYLRVTFRGEGTVRLHQLWVTEFRLHTPRKGDFVCSDPDINRIYEGAKRTAMLTTLDVSTVDTDRERQGWFCGGDCYWVPLTNYAAFGECKIPRRMFQMAVDNAAIIPGPHPLLPMWCGSRTPDNWDGHLQSGSLWAIIQLSLDERFTGEPSFVRAMLPHVRVVLNSFESFLNREGLIELRPGQPDWIEHSSYNSILADDPEQLKTFRIIVGTNAMYMKTLRDAARLERLFGDKALAARYEQRAESVRDAVNKYSGAGPFYPVLIVRDNEGRLGPGPKFYESVQYYAMWAEIPSKERAELMWSKLRGDFIPIMDPSRKVPEGLIAADCPYSFMERLEAARGLGDYEGILLSMKAVLLTMLNNGPGTFWERLWIGEEASQGILSGTGAYLTENFLGIRVGLPLKITPHSGGMLRWCKGYMTTPKGRVDVNWNWQNDKYTITISLPKKLTAEVLLPDEARAIWQSAPAKSEWNQSILIKGTTSVIVEPGQIRVDK